MTLAKKVERSMRIIREAVDRKSGAPLIVNFSGGKDSSAVLLLAMDATDDIELLYMESGLDLPGSVEFVQEQAKRWGFKLHMTNPVRDYKGDFAYWVRRFGYFPSFTYNFCSSRLKLRPARAYFRKLYGLTPIYKLSGVRLYESNRRAQIYKGDKDIQADWEHSGSFIVNPIRLWTDDDVRVFLKQHAFSINKNYKPFGVSGCYWCPFYEKAIYCRIMKVYPDIYDDIIALENELQKPSVAGNNWLGKMKETFLSGNDRQTKPDG